MNSRFWSFYMGMICCLIYCSILSIYNVSRADYRAIKKNYAKIENGDIVYINKDIEYILHGNDDE